MVVPSYSSSSNSIHNPEMGIRKKHDSNVATGVTYGVASSSNSSNSLFVIRKWASQKKDVSNGVASSLSSSNSIRNPETGIPRIRGPSEEHIVSCNQECDHTSYTKLH